MMITECNVPFNAGTVVEDHKPPEEEPKKEESAEKKQERDWRLDEDFKKFMGNPSIESALKLERKRAEERLREIDSQEQGNFFKGIINSVVRYMQFLILWACHAVHVQSYWAKICGPYVVTLTWTLLFAWYVAWLVSKNVHEKDMCYYEIGLCAQNIDTILGSIVNTFETAYMIT
jgi:hypothetical protein